jgi:NAD(P)-dependent dehydrogenase (short-subunit alcohol dehydrogenase family)
MRNQEQRPSRTLQPFAGKVAVVTGGASGIGESICRYLGARGVYVVVADRSLEPAWTTAAAIRQQGGRSHAAFVDVTQPAAVQALVTSTVQGQGRIDFLFNNAGIGINGEFRDTTLDHWRQILDVNLWGVVYGCHYVYPIMLAQGSGHIVNTASLAGLIPGGLTSSYSASKHAVVGFTLTLRAEAAHYGIKVSALCPGYMRTNIQQTSLTVTEYMRSAQNEAMNARMKFPTPDDCIDQIMAGVARNRAVIVAPRWHGLFWLLYRTFPGASIKMWTTIIARMQRQA